MQENNSVVYIQLYQSSEIAQNTVSAYLLPDYAVALYKSTFTFTFTFIPAAKKSWLRLNYFLLTRDARTRRG